MAAVPAFCLFATPLGECAVAWDDDRLGLDVLQLHNYPDTRQRLRNVDVFGMPEVRRDNIQVDASGQISFPLVGSIAAVGRTPDELASEIEAGLHPL